MFRISCVFETSAVMIVKVSGQVVSSQAAGLKAGPSKDAPEAGWPAFLDGLRSEGGRWVVLDLAEVTRIDARSTDILVRRLPDNVLLLNCPTDMRNVMYSAGLSGQVLDPNEPERCFLPERCLVMNNPAHRPGAGGRHGSAAA